MRGHRSRQESLTVRRTEAVSSGGVSIPGDEACCRDCELQCSESHAPTARTVRLERPKIAGRGTAARLMQASEKKLPL